MQINCEICGLIANSNQEFLNHKRECNSELQTKPTTHHGPREVGIGRIIKYQKETETKSEKGWKEVKTKK